MLCQSKRLKILLLGTLILLWSRGYIHAQIYPTHNTYNGESTVDSGRIASGLHYYEAEDHSGVTLRSFTIPIMLPLEATIGNFYLGGAVEYNVQEFQYRDGKERSNEYGYFRINSSYQALNTRRIRIELRESFNVPLYSKNEEKLSRTETHFRSDGYQLDSGFSMSYLMSNAFVQFDLGHHWIFSNAPTEDNYYRGNRFSARIQMGYGLGNETMKNPVNLLLGFTSDYYLPDQYESNDVRGTEYGTVFFAPGLQLSGKTIVFHAMFEFPIHQTIPQDELQYQDRVRANIGMRYFLH